MPTDESAGTILSTKELYIYFPPTEALYSFSSKLRAPL